MVSEIVENPLTRCLSGLKKSTNQIFSFQTKMQQGARDCRFEPYYRSLDRGVTKSTLGFKNDLDALYQIEFNQGVVFCWGKISRFPSWVG